MKWKSYVINIPKNIGRTCKAVKAGDINGDGKPDIVHTTNTNGEKDKIRVAWMSFKNAPTDSDWQWNDISGIIGYKFDRIELIDLDGDGDLDVLTYEENYGTNSKGLGVICYENPINKK